MTPENQANLLQAYKSATIAGRSDIADLLKDVILGEMDEGRNHAYVTRPLMKDTGMAIDTLGRVSLK